MTEIQKGRSPFWNVSLNPAQLLDKVFKVESCLFGVGVATEVNEAFGFPVRRVAEEVSAVVCVVVRVVKTPLMKPVSKLLLVQIIPPPAQSEFTGALAIIVNIDWYLEIKKAFRWWLGIEI